MFVFSSFCAGFCILYTIYSVHFCAFIVNELINPLAGCWSVHLNENVDGSYSLSGGECTIRTKKREKYIRNRGKHIQNTRRATEFWEMQRQWTKAEKEYEMAMAMATATITICFCHHYNCDACQKSISSLISKWSDFLFHWNERNIFLFFSFFCMHKLINWPLNRICYMHVMQSKASWVYVRAYVRTFQQRQSAL